MGKEEKEISLTPGGSKVMKTLERIYTEADDYGFRVPYDGSKKFYNESAVKGYIDGAKSERNKTIDEAIALIEKDFTYKTVVEKLNSLKI